MGLDGDLLVRRLGLLHEVAEMQQPVLRQGDDLSCAHHRRLQRCTPVPAPLVRLDEPGGPPLQRIGVRDDG